MQLNTTKFEKVWALAERGGTDGECISAFLRAKELAAKAGVTIKDAVTRLALPPVKEKQRYEDYDNDCSVMPFGRYEGVPLDEIPVEYLGWLIEQEWFHRKFFRLAVEVRGVMRNV